LRRSPATCVVPAGGLYAAAEAAFVSPCAHSSPSSTPPAFWLAQLDTRADRVVAIKRVRKVSYKEGVNLGAIKELQALTELNHPNILKVRTAPRLERFGVPWRLGKRLKQTILCCTHAIMAQLLDSFVYGDRIHLVLEYCPLDLTALIRDKCVSLGEAAQTFSMRGLAGAPACLIPAPFTRRPRTATTLER
jgi:hypothetical protein